MVNGVKIGSRIRNNKLNRVFEVTDIKISFWISVNMVITLRNVDTGETSTTTISDDGKTWIRAFEDKTLSVEND